MHYVLSRNNKQLTSTGLRLVKNIRSNECKQNGKFVSSLVTVLHVTPLMYLRLQEFIKFL